MKLLKFDSKKKFLFKIQGMYVPGGVDVDFIVIRAVDKSTAVSIMKSILRNKRKSSKKDYYKIMSVVSLDDIDSDVSRIAGVFYQY